MSKTEQKNNHLPVTAVQCRRQKVIGFKVVTGPQHIENDFSRLWRERFKPFMERVFPYSSTQFGVCRSYELYLLHSNRPFNLLFSAQKEKAD